MDDDQKLLLKRSNLIRRVKYDNSDHLDYEGGNMDDPDMMMMMGDMADNNKPMSTSPSKKKKRRLKKARICGKQLTKGEAAQNEEILKQSMSEINIEFGRQQTFEIWLVFIFKFLTSLVFLIDDLTFLLFCIYEFHMTVWETGILFFCTAICVLAYGLTITGFIIDKLGVKFSLFIGFILYAITKFFLIFIDNRAQLYFIMLTCMPFAISLIFPTLVLAIKRLTLEKARPLAFSIFFGAMILGAVFGGPIVDWIRHDYKHSSVTYKHENSETGKEQDREQEFSAYRIVQFFGFIVYLIMIIFLCFYNPEKEKFFIEEKYDQAEIDKLTCLQIFKEVVGDYKFWRFFLFSFVIVGPKLVFALLFFMLPKIIIQDYGEDAPFGIYVSVAPLLIIIFLFCVQYFQNNYDPYDLILLGTSIETTGPIPMFFGMNIVDFVIFIVIISFAEALYAPMINVFTFNFTKPGREGTFLTLTAAPTYFTMAFTGLLGGYLLENYYPETEDETHQKRPWVIWLIIIIISAVCVLILFIFRDYFNCVDENGNDIEDQKAMQLIEEEIN